MVVIHVVAKKERQQVIKQGAVNHNDLYKIEEVLKEILALLEEAGIEHKGLFLNADARFDSKYQT